MNSKRLILLISGIALIIFGLNSFFEFIPFENQKNNSLIILILSVINFIFLIRMINKNLN
jgi:hypothetical protein